MTGATSYTSDARRRCFAADVVAAAASVVVLLPRTATSMAARCSLWAGFCGAHHLSPAVGAGTGQFPVQLGEPRVVLTEVLVDPPREQAQRSAFRRRRRRYDCSLLQPFSYRQTRVVTRQAAWVIWRWAQAVSSL
jgi:hypothetical protein